MLPVHKLLSRIRWDPGYRRGRFSVGYFDRVERRIMVVPFETIHFRADAPATFAIWDEDGIEHRIPFHWVRRVCRDGRVIWERRPPARCASGRLTGYLVQRFGGARLSAPGRVRSARC